MAGPRVGMTKEHQPPEVDSDPDPEERFWEVVVAVGVFLLASKGWGLGFEHSIMTVGVAFLIIRWLGFFNDHAKAMNQDGYAWNLPHPGLTRPPAPQGSGGDVDRAMALMRAKIAEAQAAQPFYPMMYSRRQDQQAQPDRPAAIREHA